MFVDITSPVGSFVPSVCDDVWVSQQRAPCRYTGTKLERARDLFEQCVEGCPPEHAKTFFVLYAKLEEDHGLVRHAMSILDRATRAVQASQRRPRACLHVCGFQVLFQLFLSLSRCAHPTPFLTSKGF